MASANSAPPPTGELDHVASTPKAVLGCTAFVIFWLMAVFPSVRFLPIGRTAGAVMSAALMVAFKVLTPAEAFAAVNLPTVGLLFGTMIVSTFLERAGAFEYLGWLLAWKSLGGADLLCRLCIFSALSAALLTNDTTCFILTSFILGLCRARGLPPQPYLVGLATSANIGSALTPIGNPQNLIISINGRVSFGRFLVGLIAPVVVSVAVNMLGLLLVYARRLSKKLLARKGVKELGLPTKDGQSATRGKEVKDRASTEMGLGEGFERSSGRETETGFSKESKGDESKDVVDTGFVNVQETASAEGLNGNGKEETGSGSEPETGARSLEPQASGIVIPIDEEVVSALRPADRHPEAAWDDANGRVQALDDSSSKTHSETGRKELARRSDGATCRIGGVFADEGRAVNGDVSSKQSVSDGALDTVASLSDRSPRWQTVEFNHPSSAQILPSDTPPGVTSDSGESRGESAHSDGLRTCSKPRPHQVEVVVVPFPDLEHREGVPAVAPTGRLGRLKRLRKKRPRWLFKASVYLVVAGMLAALLAGLDLPWVAMGAAVILIVLDFRDAEATLNQVSYSLLVFFSGMFIAVEGFNRTGIPGQIWAWLEPHARLDTAPGTILLATVVTLLSNVASNVPTVLLLGPRVAASAATTAGISETYAWLFLAFTSTVAGNLTMVGSAANLIVSEEAFRAKDGMQYKLSFWNHLRYGLPSTIIILAVGIPLING